MAFQDSDSGEEEDAGDVDENWRLQRLEREKWVKGMYVYVCIFIYHPLHWLHLNYALLRSSTGLIQYVCLYIRVFMCIR